MCENPPTQWAYDQACKALEKHRKRADAMEKVVEAALVTWDHLSDAAHRGHPLSRPLMEMGFKHRDPNRTALKEGVQ